MAAPVLFLLLLLVATGVGFILACCRVSWFF
jgi:hypothetical protein